MKILVPTKRVPDTDQKIVASADGSRVEVDHVPHVVNPFDAIALEEAVRIKERGEATEERDDFSAASCEVQGAFNERLLGGIVNFAF